VLEGGAVVETGAPNALLAGDTRFRRQGATATGGALAYGG
jgi:hypothetical protein